MVSTKHARMVLQEMLGRDSLWLMMAQYGPLHWSTAYHSFVFTSMTGSCPKEVAFPYKVSPLLKVLAAKIDHMFKNKSQESNSILSQWFRIGRMASYECKQLSHVAQGHPGNAPAVWWTRRPWIPTAIAIRTMCRWRRREGCPGEGEIQML